MVNTYLLQQLLNTLHENAVHSVVTIAVFCLSVKGGRRGSPLSPTAAFTRLCFHWKTQKIYFRPAPNPYLLSEFAVVKKGMDNRFLEMRGQGFRKTEYLEECQANICVHYMAR